MKQTNRALIAVGTIAASLWAASAFADDEVYHTSFRVGAYFVFYHSHADDISGPYVPAGVNLDAKDTQTLYVGITERISPHFETELALGYPPQSKVEGRGPATLGSVPYNGQIISSARWLSPTLLLEYKFLPETAKLRPYIGVGVNYTTFYDRDSTAQGNAATGGPTRLSLTASVGPVGTVGLSYNVSGRWHVYASYSISQVKTTLDAETAGVKRTTRISFGPQALVISGGYSF